MKTITSIEHFFQEEEITADMKGVSSRNGISWDNNDFNKEEPFWNYDP